MSNTEWVMLGIILGVVIVVILDMLINTSVTKLLNNMLKIRTIKWLLKWHQVRADSWTKACNNSDANTPEKKQMDTQIWAENYKYHMDHIHKLIDKMEEL